MSFPKEGIFRNLAGKHFKREYQEKPLSNRKVSDKTIFRIRAELVRSVKLLVGIPHEYLSQHLPPQSPLYPPLDLHHFTLKDTLPEIHRLRMARPYPYERHLLWKQAAALWFILDLGVIYTNVSMNIFIS